MTIKGAIQAGQRRGRLVFSIKRRVSDTVIQIRDDLRYPQAPDPIRLAPAYLSVVDLTATDWELLK